MATKKPAAAKKPVAKAPVKDLKPKKSPKGGHALPAVHAIRSPARP